METEHRKLQISAFTKVVLISKNVFVPPRKFWLTQAEIFGSLCFTRESHILGSLWAKRDIQKLSVWWYFLWLYNLWVVEGIIVGFCGSAFCTQSFTMFYTHWSCSAAPSPVCGATVGGGIDANTHLHKQLPKHTHTHTHTHAFNANRVLMDVLYGGGSGQDRVFHQRWDIARLIRIRNVRQSNPGRKMGRIGLSIFYIFLIVSNCHDQNISHSFSLCAIELYCRPKTIKNTSVSHTVALGDMFPHEHTP